MRKFDKYVMSHYICLVRACLREVPGQTELKAIETDRARDKTSKKLLHFGAKEEAPRKKGSDFFFPK